MKIRMPENTKKTDYDMLQNVSTGIVYRNALHPKVFLYQHPNTGGNVLIESNNFYYYDGDYDALEHLQSEDIADAWVKTDLDFVISLEPKE